MKTIADHFSDQQALIYQLRGQIELLREAIFLLEQESSCLEIIRRVQQVEVVLSAANIALVNIYLTRCLADLTEQEHTEEALDEISMLFCCLENH